MEASREGHEEMVALLLSQVSIVIIVFRLDIFIIGFNFYVVDPVILIVHTFTYIAVFCYIMPCCYLHHSLFHPYVPRQVSWSYRISCSKGVVRPPSPPHSLLPTQGADINAQTEETQETALTLACCGGFLEVADFLIKVKILLTPAP